MRFDLREWCHVLVQAEQMTAMMQLRLVETGFLPETGKRTRQAVFLAGMETVFPWSRLQAQHDVPQLRGFAGLYAFEDVMPDKSTFLRFRHLLDEADLTVAIFAGVNAVLSEKGLSMKRGTVVDANLIAAPSSTNNEEMKSDPEMMQTKKGILGVDALSGLVHTAECMTDKVA